MKQYCKNTRLKIYKKSLGLLKGFEKTKAIDTGLCYCLVLALEYYGFETPRDWANITERFMEVNKRKPINAKFRWFPISDYKSRINILNEAIEELKNELR